MSLINIRPNYNFKFINEVEDTNSLKVSDEIEYSSIAAEAYLYVTGLTGNHANHQTHLETKINDVWTSIGLVVGDGSVRYSGPIDDLRYNITVPEGSASASNINISAVTA
ncbi:hypothetical protein KAR91_84655 [Candidatus Pacearchaeota archaeon]|nr:hypothetical protein [Candidatus Pacearchaeota archaeon]